MLNIIPYDCLWCITLVLDWKSLIYLSQVSKYFNKVITSRDWLEGLLEIEKNKKTQSFEIRTRTIVLKGTRIQHGISYYFEKDYTSTTDFKFGKINGYHRVYYKGNLCSEHLYIKDIIQISECWRKSRRERVYFQKGIKVAKIEWYSNGNILSKIFYNGERFNGITKRWNEDGSIKIIGCNGNDFPQGEWVASWNKGPKIFFEWEMVKYPENYMSWGMSFQDFITKILNTLC